MLVRRLSLIIVVLFCQCAYAVDESRLWLPKKHQSIKPGLLAAATEAEQTERCVTVVRGEMIVRKNTDTHYYFLITCRDTSARTYSLSYLYPVAGDRIELVAEQQSLTPTAGPVESEGLGLGLGGLGVGGVVNSGISKELEGIAKGDGETEQNLDRDFEEDFEAYIDAAADTGVAIESESDADTEKTLVADEEVALSLCFDGITNGPAYLDGIEVLESDVGPVQIMPEGFSYQIPFVAKTLLANRVLYQAQCLVSGAGDVRVEIALEREGAIAICRENIRAETIAYGRIRLHEDEIAQMDSEGQETYRFEFPFDIENRIGTVIRYNSECTIDAEGATDVVIQLTPKGAFSTCKDSLQTETLLMKSVEINEAASEIKSESNGVYNLNIPFTAKTRSGRNRQYTAHCYVDEDGGTDILTEIDRETVVSVCVDDLEIKTGNMKFVKILEDSIQLVKDSYSDGYNVALEFNAESPSGRQLQYKANCRLENNGQSQIDISAR